MKRKVFSVFFALMLVLSLGVVMAAPVAAADAVVDIVAIPGVTAPVTGGTPVTAITPTDQYTGAVTWTPDPGATFLGEQDYTAIIILTAEAGYTLTGVAANFFTVAGATATNPAGSGVVTAVFPATAAVVDIAAIPGVTAPALGGTPVAAITPTAQYTGTVTWSPDEDPFLGEQAYTATITLTAKTGFTLTGVGLNFFTVTGATATNPADSGVVTAVFPATDAAVVDIAAIPGVTVPVIDESPVTVITPTAQYTGAIVWDPIADPFTGVVNTATITLTAEAGFTLTGVTADFFTVAGATATNDADLGVVTAVFPIAEAAAVVDIVAIPGVTAPAVGGTPVTEITETAQYTGTVTWSPVNDPFLGATVYTATITLTAKTGFTLTGVAADSFTVTGATATNPADSGVVSAVFPATAAAVVIDIAAIPGVTAPVTGGTPVAAIAPTAQYTGTVVWTDGDDPFAGNKIYTATITLTAKAGYTLTGVAADFFTVTGATATNTASSDVVSAVFPATDAVVSIAAIPGVTAPVIGGTPVAAITPTAQYTGTVAWSPVVATTFLGGQIYTATITLTAEAGFTLTGVAENYFTVAGADSVANPADSGVVSAVFPATDAVIDIAAIPGVTAPEIGGTPVTAITPTAQYTGTVTWSPADATFAGETAYTAIIILTAEAGYTLEGVAANSFTVAGATATNPANSGVVTAVFPVTYDVIMVLPADTWVLISTPLWISTDSAWIDEPVLVYKAAGSVFSTDVTLAVDLQPVEALYVKMGSEEGSLGIIFSTDVQGVSAKELVAGWNLISSASSVSPNAQAVLSGLQDVALDGTGLTTVVSQGIYNAFSADFYVDATIWGNLATYTLEPLDGYWIRMNADKTFGVVPQP